MNELGVDIGHLSVFNLDEMSTFNWLQEDYNLFFKRRHLLAEGYPYLSHSWLYSYLTFYCLVCAVGYFAIRKCNMQLRTPMRIYNAWQILFNGYMVSIAVLCMGNRLLMGAVHCSFSLGTKDLIHAADIDSKSRFTISLPLHPHSVFRLEAFVCYLFFFSKLLDMLDTIWIILRGRVHQFSFLHVYHHTAVIVMYWAMAHYFPGGVSVWNVICNGTIHVIMYTYYFLSSFPSMAKKLWWKRYLTLMQMIQLIILVSIGSMGLFYHWKYGNVNHSFIYGVTMNSFGFSLLLLFANYYRKSYSSAKIKAS